MVSEYIKVRNTDFNWIKMVLFQSFENQLGVTVILDTVNALELIIEHKSVLKTRQVKLIISSDDKRAGLVKISVKPMHGKFTRGGYYEYALDVWEIAAETLRYSLDGKKATQKCWNCFEDRDFRSNFCEHCGKE